MTQFGGHDEEKKIMAKQSRKLSEKPKTIGNKEFLAGQLGWRLPFWKQHG